MEKKTKIRFLPSSPPWEGGEDLVVSVLCLSCVVAMAVWRCIAKLWEWPGACCCWRWLSVTAWFGLWVWLCGVGAAAHAAWT